MSEAPKAPEPPKDLPPGQFGQFLKELGINSTRHPDSSGGVETIEVDGKDLQSAMKRLKNSPEIALNCLLAVSGVDNPETFEAVYHLWSYEDPAKELVIKSRVSKESLAEDRLPAIPTLANFWPAANWHERETYDLLGIRFVGHPYLRRILNPWDWEGYPLRRDYKQPIDALNDKNPHSMR